jgi:hypothetical protein
LSCEKSYFPPKRARSSLECKDKDTSCTAFFWFVSLLRLNLQKSTFIYKSLHLSTFHGLKSLQKSTKVYKSLQESTRVYNNLHFSTKIFKNLHLSAFIFNLWSKKSARIFKSLHESSRIFIYLQEFAFVFNSLQNSSISCWFFKEKRGKNTMQLAGKIDLPVRES